MNKLFIHYTPKTRSKKLHSIFKDNGVTSLYLDINNDWQDYNKLSINWFNKLAKHFILYLYFDKEGPTNTFINNVNFNYIRTNFDDDYKLKSYQRRVTTFPANESPILHLYKRPFPNLDKRADRETFVYHPTIFAMDKDSCGKPVVSIKYAIENDVNYMIVNIDGAPYIPGMLNLYNKAII
jgi:hypothetical protein